MPLIAIVGTGREYETSQIAVVIDVHQWKPAGRIDIAGCNRVRRANGSENACLGLTWNLSQDAAGLRSLEPHSECSCECRRRTALLITDILIFARREVGEIRGWNLHVA